MLLEGAVQDMTWISWRQIRHPRVTLSCRVHARPYRPILPDIIGKGQIEALGGYCGWTLQPQS